MWGILLFISIVYMCKSRTFFKNDLVFLKWLAVPSICLGAVLYWDYFCILEACLTLAKGDAGKEASNSPNVPSEPGGSGGIGGSGGPGPESSHLYPDPSLHKGKEKQKDTNYKDTRRNQHQIDITISVV